MKTSLKTNRPSTLHKNLESQEHMKQSEKKPDNFQFSNSREFSYVNVPASKNNEARFGLQTQRSFSTSTTTHPNDFIGRRFGMDSNCRI